MRIPLRIRAEGFAPYEYVLDPVAEGTRPGWRPSLVDEEQKLAGLAEGSLPRFVTREAAASKAREHFGLDPERAVSVGASLEWLICRQSRSPFMPFWRVVVDPESPHEVPVFVRIDGPVFPELSPLRPGD